MPKTAYWHLGAVLFLIIGVVSLTSEATLPGVLALVIAAGLIYAGIVEARRRRNDG